MRPRVVGLTIAVLLALILSLLILLLSEAQQSLKLDQKQKQQKVGTTSAEKFFNPEGSDSDWENSSPLVWFNKLKRYLAELVGLEPDEEEEGSESEIFRPTKLGYLNYQRRYANSISSFVSATIPPTAGNISGYDGGGESLMNTSGSGGEKGDSAETSNSSHYKTGSQSQVQYHHDQMILLTESEQGTREVEKDSNLVDDILSTYRMNRQTITKQQQHQNDRDELPHNVECHNSSKYDRLIEQKMNTKDLSRPILTPDGRFDNPFPTWNKQSIVDTIKFVVWEANESNVPDDRDELEKELPVIRPVFNYNNNYRKNISLEENGEEFRATWIGHASLLIQVDGYNILTDPMFSERASFTQFFGPKRIRQPACNIQSLPHIDIVLISHNHYDHLDTNSVRELNDRFGRGCRWIVPLGIGDFLRSMSVENYIEIDWWQKDCFHIDNDKQTITTQNTHSKDLSNDSNKSIAQTRMILEKSSPSRPPPSPPPPMPTRINIDQSSMDGKPETTRRIQHSELGIYLTPSQHWSRRGVNDVNKSLWGSFVIVNKNGATFFFGGDTAYCSAFKEIGNIFGPFVGAAIPIGAYKPRWFLKTSHVDPNEAVQIHEDLRSMKSIAIHHSTFILSSEDYKEPPRLLREIMDKRKVNGRNKEPFITLKHGETARFCKTC